MPVCPISSQENALLIAFGCHFWRDKMFLKIGMATPQRYPVSQKSRQNRSI